MCLTFSMDNYFYSESSEWGDASDSIKGIGEQLVNHVASLIFFAHNFWVAVNVFKSKYFVKHFYGNLLRR